MPATRNTRPGPDEPDDSITEDETEAETDVDLDLLANDAQYREALADPLFVKLPTGATISIPPMADWPHLGTRLVTTGLFDGWADTVMSVKDAAAFKKADLHNYQIEKITDACAAASRISAGKRRPSSPSRKSTRRR
jgi:hypothetical protein